MRVATARTPARAALAGNPSDGYGGMTLAVCLPQFAAQAMVTEGSTIVWEAEPDRVGTDGQPLIRAAVRHFARLRHDGAPVDRDASNGFFVDVRTTIPRQVGLAGSSAIVISVLRALAELHGVEIDDDLLVSEALLAETDDLGIAAGPQDRVVQVHGGLLAMDFASGRHEALDPALLPPLFVAWRQDGGQTSGIVHSRLRERHASGEADVVEGMRTLARLAALARDALVDGDPATFARCLDGSFDVRAGMVELDPVDARLVAVAREHGAAANYAGSGGAVVGVLGDARADGLAAAYEAEGFGFAPAEVAS